MAQNPSGIQTVDSLSANEFAVEVNGAAVAGVFSVSGLCTRCVDMTAGQLAHAPVVITKMVQRDPKVPFNVWTRETLANPTSQKVTREVAVIALDEGVEVRRWVLKNAWISEIMFSDFDTSSSELIEERLTLQHSGVVEIWP